MSRRTTIVKREILPDPVYNSRLVTKFINNVTKAGKKTVAERIFYGALGLIEERTGDDPVKVFKRAVDNTKPQVEVKSRRVGGSTYQIPIEVRSDRSITLAMRWVVDAAKRRSEKNMGLRLAGEFLDAAENKGTAIKKREDTHRMAEANKAFSHFRW